MKVASGSDQSKNGSFYCEQRSPMALITSIWNWTSPNRFRDMGRPSGLLVTTISVKRPATSKRFTTKSPNSTRTSSKSSRWPITRTTIFGCSNFAEQARFRPSRSVWRNWLAVAVALRQVRFTANLCGVSPRPSVRTWPTKLHANARRLSL